MLLKTLGTIAINSPISPPSYKTTICICYLWKHKYAFIVNDLAFENIESCKIIFINLLFQLIKAHVSILSFPTDSCSSETKCLKNQPCDVIKMSHYPSLFWGFSFLLFLSSHSFLWLHMADFWDTLSRYIPALIRCPENNWPVRL